MRADSSDDTNGNADETEFVKRKIIHSGARGSGNGRRRRWHVQCDRQLLARRGGTRRRRQRQNKKQKKSKTAGRRGPTTGAGTTAGSTRRDDHRARRRNEFSKIYLS